MITNIQCRGARALLGLSLRDLYEATGLAIATLSNWENGKTQMHPNHVAAVERILIKRGLRIGENPTAIWIEPQRTET